jgi:hypothetical protein
VRRLKVTSEGDKKDLVPSVDVRRIERALRRQGVSEEEIQP